MLPKWVVLFFSVIQEPKPMTYVSFSFLAKTIDVLRKNKVIAKETQKGTEKMLLGIKKINDYSGILIKFPKK